MSSDDYVANDETLYPTRGGISFKTYNKDKSAKYGLNLKILGSSRRPYVYCTISYMRKPVEMTGTQIKDTFSLVQQFVKGFEEQGHSLKGTNISMDIYYTSIFLAKWMHEKNNTCVITIQMNQKGLPIEMKEPKDCKEFSWIPCKENNGPVTLNSYVVKTKSIRKRKVKLIVTKYL